MREMVVKREALSAVELMGAVHVWYLFTDHVTHRRLVDWYVNVMSPDERKRSGRFVFAKDQAQFIVTRGLVRTLLSGYGRIRPEECTFVTNRYGKPSLVCHGSTPEGLEFNVSHTNGLVAVAITIGRQVGIDVEELTRIPLDPKLHRFFAHAEAKALEALPQAEQTSQFLAYWTLKEAYLKACGTGLSVPLDSFAIHLEMNKPPTIEFSPTALDDASSWQFAQFDPTPRHRIALAIRRHGTDIPIRIEEFELENEVASDQCAPSANRL
jgi:4'-phosphopantetheinyl transferase